MCKALQFAQNENHEGIHLFFLLGSWTCMARPADTKLICGRKIGTQLLHNSVFRSSFETVLVQPEMERWRFPGISKASIRPPSYPSAWLRPRRARFRFARQDHFSSTTSIRLNFRLALGRNLNSEKPNCA